MADGLDLEAMSGYSALFSGAPDSAAPGPQSRLTPACNTELLATLVDLDDVTRPLPSVESLIHGYADRSVLDVSPLS